MKINPNNINWGISFELMEDKLLEITKPTCQSRDSCETTTTQQGENPSQDSMNPTCENTDLNRIIQQN